MKKQDKVVLVVFVFFLLILVVIFILLSQNDNLKSIENSEEMVSDKKEVSAGGGLVRDGAVFSTITLKMMFEPGFERVKARQIRGAEFRADYGNITPRTSKHIAMQKGVKAFLLRAAIYGKRLVVVLSERDGGDFEIIHDCVVRDLSESAVVWEGSVFKQNGDILMKEIFVCQENRSGLPTRKDVIYSFYGDTRKKRIKNYKFGNVNFSF